MIDDQIQPGQLHLLRLVPLAWLKTDEQTSFENMPTEFGPVTLQFTLRQEGKQLDVSFEPRFRYEPNEILLHVPPLPGLREVAIDGRILKAKPGDVLSIRSGNPNSG